MASRQQHRLQGWGGGRGELHPIGEDILDRLQVGDHAELEQDAREEEHSQSERGGEGDKIVGHCEQPESECRRCVRAKPATT